MTQEEAENALKKSFYLQVYISVQEMEFDLFTFSCLIILNMFDYNNNNILNMSSKTGFVLL